MAAPYQVVQQVFDAAAATAASMSTTSQQILTTITNNLAALNVPPNINLLTPQGPSTPSITGTPNITEPNYTFESVTVPGVTFDADYAARVAAAQAAVTSNLSSFFNTYFPMTLNGTDLTLAQGWVIQVLNNGGAMNAAIENQYWQRDRDRIARESSVKQAEAISSWASRGFPLPPGAAVGAVLDVQRGALEQLSASSREVAIKKFEMEIQLQQKAVEYAMTLRQTAVSAMIDYIRAQVFDVQQDAVAFGTSKAGATSTVSQQLIDYFSSVAKANNDFAVAKGNIQQAKEMITLEYKKAEADRAFRAADSDLSIKKHLNDSALQQNELVRKMTLDITGKNVEVALAGAQMAATQAAAALNGIHATAGVSGSSSDNTQYYG